MQLKGKTEITIKWCSSVFECKLTVSQYELIIPSSKTDQYAKSVSLIFTPSNDRGICPVRAVKRFLQLRPLVGGPLFCHFSDKTVSKYQFRAMLSKCLACLGLNQTLKVIRFRMIRICMKCTSSTCVKTPNASLFSYLKYNIKLPYRRTSQILALFKKANAFLLQSIVLSCNTMNTKRNKTDLHIYLHKNSRTYSICIIVINFLLKHIAFYY